MVTNGKNGNGKKREETAARIIKAILECNGLLTIAAKRANVGVTTIYRYVNEYPSVKQASIEAKESMLDFAEGKLYSKIKAGDNVAILFYLKCQGKARGYIERTEISNPEGESFRVEHSGREKLISAINRLAARAGEDKDTPKPDGEGS